MSNNYDNSNLKNEKEILNYLDLEKNISNINSSEQINNIKENYDFNFNSQNINNQNNKIQNQEELLDMELKNIQMLILQRSLYILKKKFEMNKKELEIIFQKYKDEDYMQLKCINVDYLLELYKEIMDTTQFILLPYNNFNELITADLMTEINEGKRKTVLKNLVKFTLSNVEKYNRIYFEKKIKKKKLIEENEKKKVFGLAVPETGDFTTKQKIIKIDKRGKIIRDFEEMIENNKEFNAGKEVIVKINEEDLEILSNKKLLYSDVITLIIADFLQVYLKNNENIAIISTSNDSEDKENIKLNHNVKSLFDNEIIKFYNNLNKIDQNQENKEKLKSLLFELMNIETQIKIYQNLILGKTDKGDNVKHLLNMQKKLNEHKIIIQKKINLFSIKSNHSKKGLEGDVSVINNTESNFGNNTSSDKNNLIQKYNPNLKCNKNLKPIKNIKYKIKLTSSNISVNTKNMIIKNNHSSNDLLKNKNKIRNLNLSDKNIINVNINGSEDNNIYNNINTNENNKYNYYYNNDNFYYQHGIKAPETKEDIRKNNLLEIFYFYTKQHTFIGKTPTFQEILKSEEHLDLSAFGKFCVEFKILVKPQKISEIFKKTASNGKDLNYALFIKILQKLSVYANEEKKQILMDRIKVNKMKLKESKEKNKNNEENINKEKEENISGNKNEGEIQEEDDKYYQKYNIENQQQEENKEKDNKKKNNGKNKNNEKSFDKKTINNINNFDKKSNKSINNNDKKINKSNNNIEKKSNIDSQNKNSNENLNSENNNKKEEQVNNSQNNNNQNNNMKKNIIGTNLKYYKKNKSKSKNKIKLQKGNNSKSLLMVESKEELEEKISKLEEDYDKLNQKTNSQLEEEFYQYLEIDDTNLYRKKMVGYIYPFVNRENDSRFPIQSVARPIKRDPKVQKEMHKILVQRHEDLKKEKELKQLKEKNMLFEKRQKKFEEENRKIQEKMSLKNDYVQLKRNGENYQKEKMNKLTWEQIQNCDYDAFILEQKDTKKKYKKNNLDDIFTNKINQFEGDDGDFLQNFKLKKGFDETSRNEDDKSTGNNNKLKINFNNINNNLSNNLNRYENMNKTEPFGTSNLSRISSDNNFGNNSEYVISNSIGSKK